MLDAVAELIKIEVKLARMTRELGDRILGAPPEGAPDATIWCDYGFKWPAYTLVHLYRTEHPDNPLFGADWCVGLAEQLVDKLVADWQYRTGRGLGVSSLEVPHYIIAALLEWLGDGVTAERRAKWKAYSGAWAQQALQRPGGFTGNYHDTWRMLSLFRLGQVLDRPEWCEMAVLLFRQMIALQTAEGFWEEGRHHGPSMRYNGLMLHTLAWMYRLTGDEQFAISARALAGFMATYTYPDALTVGPFDGRNCPMLGFFPSCPGLELVAQGRALNARAFELWQTLGAPEDMRLSVESTRDAVRLAFYAADTCVYLSEYVPPEEQKVVADSSGGLPVDREGTTENHTITFDGVLHRHGPWVAALSGQTSGIPRYAPNVYRLERESRMELWHEHARLVLGGGHNLTGADVPYANAILDTGYAGPAEFGRIGGEEERLSRSYATPRAGGAIGGSEQPSSGRRQAQHRLFRSYYMPRLARTGVEDGTPYLELLFAHGTVRFRFLFQEPERCRIEVRWDVRHLDRLCLQLPVVVWRGGRLTLDGKEQEADAYSLRELRRELSARGGPFGSQVTLHVPDGVPARVHYPLGAQPTFSHFFENDPFQPQFSIALVSCQWTRPPPTGQARFVIGVPG